MMSKSGISKEDGEVTHAEGAFTPVDNCPNNGGTRIFPGKLDPNDNPQDPLLRRKVNLVATIDPPISGMTVYFKVWDVDDPFDKLNAAMPNLDVDDIVYVLNGFVDPPAYPEADLEPCGGDADVDIDDIVASLNAFIGFAACPDPCSSFGLRPSAR